MGSNALNLTQGNILKHIRAIAVPAIIGSIFQTLYNLTDTFWAGQLSSSSLAATGLVFPLFLIAMSISQAIAGGTMVLVSNAIGAKQEKKAAHYQEQAFSLGVVFGTILAVFTWYIVQTFFSAQNVSGQVLGDAIAYARAIGVGFPFMVVQAALGVALMSRGDTKFMRNVMILNAFINVGLDPLLMYGWNIAGIVIIPRMGVAGIGLATSFVQVLGTILLLRKVYKERYFVPKTLKSLIPIYKTSHEIFKYGLPSFVQLALVGLGLGVVNYFLYNLNGPNATAAYTVGLRIEQFALVPTMGLNIALSALVGQNNGARRIDRIRESFRLCLLLALALLGLMILVRIFAHFILIPFTRDAEVIMIAKQYLTFAVFIFYAYQLMFQASGLLQGLKRPLIPIIMVSVRQLVFPFIFIPIFAYALDWGYLGVFTSVACSAWITAIVLFVFARKKLLAREIECKQEPPTEPDIPPTPQKINSSIISKPALSPATSTKKKV